MALSSKRFSDELQFFIDAPSTMNFEVPISKPICLLNASSLGVGRHVWLGTPHDVISVPMALVAGLMVSKYTTTFFCPWWFSLGLFSPIRASHNKLAQDHKNSEMLMCLRKTNLFKTTMILQAKSLHLNSASSQSSFP